MREIIIKANESGQTLDKFISKTFKNMPFSMIYKLIRKKKITINRKRAKENMILSEGDVVLIFAPDDLLTDKPLKKASARSDITVAYEDENILIADKESGLLVHSDSDDDGEDTLIDRIQAYLIQKGEYIPENENSFSPALCNRIDRNTEGLVIAAKNASALREMNEIIKERRIDKIYLAAVHGKTEQQKGEIKLLLEKDSSENKVRVRNNGGKNVKTAITAYRVIAYNPSKDLSLLEVKLITGRTHQIRASFAHINHPLLGDGKYAVNKKDREMGYKSQALCAYSVTFDCKKSELLGYLNGLTVTAKKPRFLSLF